jgi:hypothetical protein
VRFGHTQKEPFRDAVTAYGVWFYGRGAALFRGVFGAQRLSRRYFRFFTSARRSCELNTFTKAVTLHSSATDNRSMIERHGSLRPCSRSAM